MKVGDVVALRSGGHPMTVEAVGPIDYCPDGYVRVVWMGSDQHGRPALCCRQLPVAMLAEPELPEAGPLVH